MPLRITNIGQVVKAQKAQRSKPVMSSKVLALNTEYELIFKKKDGLVASASLVGHKCDYDKLGFSFVKLLDHQIEQFEDSDRINDISGMFKWHVVSNIIHKAKWNREIEEAKSEAEKAAQRSNMPIDAIALEQKLEDIRQRYSPKKGDPERNDRVQKVFDISNEFLTVTDVLLVPLDAKNGNKPIMKEAKALEIQLSFNKMNMLANIMSNASYNDQDDPDGYLHVRWPYMGASPNIAGRADYVGLEPASRKVNLTVGEDGNFIDPEVQLAAGEIKKLSGDYDTIYSQSKFLSYSKTSADLDIAMNKYLSTLALDLTYVDFNDEYVSKNLDILVEKNVYAKSSKQYQELMEMLEAKSTDSVTVESIAKEREAEANDAVKNLEADAKLASSKDIKETVNIAKEQNREMTEETPLYEV